MKFLTAALASIDRMLGAGEPPVSHRAIVRALAGVPMPRRQGVIETRLDEADVKARIKSRWAEAERAQRQGARFRRSA